MIVHFQFEVEDLGLNDGRPIERTGGMVGKFPLDDSEDRVGMTVFVSQGEVDAPENI